MQLEVKTKEKTGFEAENKLMIERIKELEAEIASLRKENNQFFNKLTELSLALSDKSSEINQLHD